MHAIRSLVVLAVAATAAIAQTPKDGPQAAITARLVTVHESETPTFVGLFCGSTLLSRKDTAGRPGLPEVLKALEGYKAATVTLFPKLTVVSGQSGEITNGVQKKVITGFDKAGEPVTEAVHDGTRLNLKATVEAGGKGVEIVVDAKHTVVNSNVPLTPVTKLVMPAEGSPPGSPPVPFTTFHRKPDVQTGKHAGTFSVPSGGSRIWDLGTLTFRAERTVTPAVVAKVPYLNRLFASKKPTAEKYQVYLILTADALDPTDLAK